MLCSAGNIKTLQEMHIIKVQEKHMNTYIQINVVRKLN